MAVPISNVTRRVVFAPSGTGPYAFTFEILAETDIEVYKGDTKLTLTTDYTVTINVNGTGSVTLVATAGTDNITIIGARAIQRTSDFVTGGDFFANTVNTELDSLTIFAQQNAEAVARALQAPETDPTTINMTLPRAADRAGKYLAFDSNGDPQPGDTAVDVGVVAGIVNDIAAVSAIAANVTKVANIDTNVTTVAGISSNVTTVAGISSNVTTVATNNSNITTVATDLGGSDTIGTVAGSIADINTLGAIAADISTVAGIDSDVTAVAADATDIGTVAGSIADVNAVAAIAADVASVAADAADIGTVAGGIANVTTVAGSISNVNTTATNISAITTVASDLNEPVSEIETVANSIANVDALGPIASNISTVAGIAANVTTVAGISSNVTTVAGVAANVTTVAGISAAVTTVAADGADIGAVAAIDTDVTTVAGIAADVTAVAADATDIGTVATDLAGSNTIGTVAGIAANVTTVAGISADVTTVAADGTDIGVVAGISSDVTTVSGIAADVTAVAAIDSDVTAVAADATDIGTVAADLAGSNTIGTVAGIAANVTTVAGISADVTTVAADGADIGAVAAIDSDVTTVAGIAANVTTVAGISANVTSVAGNASNINQVAADTVAINAASTNATNAANSATAAAGSATAAAASAAAANAVSLGNEPVAPSIRPSLNLDFANTRALDPRITFTRTTTATYYDGKTTAKAEENLLLQSQDFTTTWVNVGSSDTANTSVAPDGTTTADTLTESASGTGQSQISQTISVVSGLSYTFSIYIKQGTETFAQLTFGASGFGSNAYANFNVTTGSGAVGTVGASATASIVDAGNGWYRCVVTATATATTSSTSAIIYIIESATDARAPNITLDSGTILLWGAQLEQRSSVTAYTPTTTAPITNYIPALQTAASGVARFDHNPTTGESLGLLVEEQRTNLCLRSEEFDNASWSKGNSSVTGNVVVAPDGTLTGDIVVANTVSGEHTIDSNLISITSGTTYTFTCYVKFAGLDEVGLRYTLGSNWPGSVSPQIKFTFSTGITSVVAGTITAHGATAVGNGWYRVFMTVAAAGTGNSSARIQLMSPSNSFVGDDYSGVYAWGAQVEAAAFPTSYIATTSASVTRNADAVSMTGTNFSSWYRADEGTVYASGSPVLSGTNVLCAINDGTNNEAINIYWNSNLVQFQVRDGNATQAAITGGASLPFVVAGAYAANDFSAYVNGSSIGADTSGSLPSPEQLRIGNLTGGSFANGTIKKIAFYPSRLTNAQLQALTAS